jgi:hypothetical protein
MRTQQCKGFAIVIDRRIPNTWSPALQRPYFISLCPWTHELPTRVEVHEELEGVSPLQERVPMRLLFTCSYNTADLDARPRASSA